MFENIINFFKKIGKKDQIESNSRDTAKERLHLVLMQDRANVSADFLDMMRQEIIEVIKKYIDVDENDIDVRLTNRTNEDGTTGAPALYANIPIAGIKEEIKKEKNIDKKTEENPAKEQTDKVLEIEDDNKNESGSENKATDDDKKEEIADKENQPKESAQALEQSKQSNNNEKEDVKEPKNSNKEKNTKKPGKENNSKNTENTKVNKTKTKK